MNVRKGILPSFSVKNIFYNKMDSKLFYFHVTMYRSNKYSNGFQRKFFKVIRSFLTGRLLTQHDFNGSVIIFISVNSEVKCNSTDVSKEDLHNGHT